MVETYNDVVAGSPNVEMIHVSRDRSDDDAEEWAEEEGFPWYTVLPDDVEDSELMEYRPNNSVPYYVIVDAEGNSLASGSTAVFAKAKEVGGSVE